MKKHFHLAFSALVFYSVLALLWNIEIIPSPSDFIPLIESFYSSYGLFALFVIVFIEALVYIGLYVPGSFLVALILISAEQSVRSLLLITVISVVSTFFASIVNYSVGFFHLFKKTTTEELKKEHHFSKKNFILACLHPNFLAFYMLKKGSSRKHFFSIFLAPIFIFPYIFLLALIIYLLKDFIIQTAENVVFTLTALLIWLIVALYYDYKKLLLKK